MPSVIARSPCDEAIQGARAVAPGLPRCARNDGGVDAAIIGRLLINLEPLIAWIEPGHDGAICDSRLAGKNARLALLPPEADTSGKASHMPGTLNLAELDEAIA